jgi:hypothetical protein
MRSMHPSPRVYLRINGNNKLTLMVTSSTVCHCLPSTIVPGPVRVLVELALLALSIDRVDNVVILLSVEDGEAIKLGRAFARFCKSFALFLCCGTFDGPVLAFPELRENMLRTLVTALLLTDSASGSGGGAAGAEYP